jgi:hypothetical protein
MGVGVSWISGRRSMERDVGEKCNTIVGAGGERRLYKKENYKMRKNKRLYHVPCSIKKISTK